MKIHIYLSTACWHEDHEYCQAVVRPDDGSPKVPACCKVCGSPCVCDCHKEQTLTRT